jgi:putative ABC transport system permease protein
MLLYFRLLKESFAFAMNALRNNKLRTMLSLLGVTIGIFSIIAVLAAVDSLDRKIKNDLEGLDKNMIYLMRFSFGPSDVPRWKSEQFPNVTYEEYEFIRKSVNNIDKMAYSAFVGNESIKFEEKTVTNVSISPGTNEQETIEGVKVDYGRFYNESESNSGTPLVILGNEVAKGLFDSPEQAIGKKIRLYGQRFTCIGVTKKLGETSFGDSSDNAAFIPVNFLRRIYGDNSKKITPSIIIKPVKGIDIDQFKAELTQKLRNYRGLKQGDIDNFFINILSGLTDMIDGLLGNIRMGGILISFFSFLVGGFGIANIMFVSVKERTNLIGIQKSLGAKNKFILFQFLFEAIILCLFGGAIGLLIVWLLAMLLSNILEFEFVLSFTNVIIGTGLSIVVGLISGILPAISASKLDPVEAIRSGM